VAEDLCAILLQHLNRRGHRRHGVAKRRSRDGSPDLDPKGRWSEPIHGEGVFWVGTIEDGQIKIARRTDFEIEKYVDLSREELGAILLLDTLEDEGADKVTMSGKGGR
jgi:hypothetical protein